MPHDGMRAAQGVRVNTHRLDPRLHRLATLQPLARALGDLAEARDPHRLVRAVFEVGEEGREPFLREGNQRRELFLQCRGGF